ncbi:sugar phosphate isomerase/epimerase family protein [uncultured Bacteroides sp.]|uniref:sugar phosphate isomerase/epimerase family protein n=1 Tax=uncultured Bacteroides sp. TaxID=162156 RepID=UPI002AABA25E|nr:sugar phosphate isomerase/epimerase family protein [uncultured Bacteroides sp.]
MKVKFGASILSWIPPNWTAEGGSYAIQKTAAAGFDLLEILLPPSMDIDTQTVKKQLKDHNLGAVCTFNLPASCHIPFYPKEATLMMKAMLNKTADLDLNFMGGVLHSGIGVFSGEPKTEKEEDTVCEVWADVADYAQKLGITIGIEPINRYESYVCTCAEETLHMIERTKAPNLALHLDTFHMNIEEDNFYNPVIAAGERLKHIHMTESNRGMLGEGNVDWDSLFRGLATIDFTGNLVLENFTSQVEGMASAVSLWRPSKYNASELAAGSLQFMKAKASEFGLL